MELSKFEWGFKMVAITNLDEDAGWLKRSKAIGIYVPSHMANIAKSIIGNYFEAAKACYKPTNINDK